VSARARSREEEKRMVCVAVVVTKPNALRWLASLSISMYEFLSKAISMLLKQNKYYNGLGIHVAYEEEDDDGSSKNA